MGKIALWILPKRGLLCVGAKANVPLCGGKKLNKKMYRAGMSVILSQLIRDERLLIVDTFDVYTYKTKVLSEKLKEIGLNEVLIVTDEMSESLYLSSRNIPHVAAVEVKNVDPVSLLRFEKILITTNGLKKFEELLS